MTAIHVPSILLANGWSVARDGAAIEKTFRFGSFPAAMAFMVRVGFVAQELDHHPEWRNVYDRVEVALTTHDAGGLTDKDFSLAAAMDALA